MTHFLRFWWSSCFLSDFFTRFVHFFCKKKSERKANSSNFLWMGGGFCHMGKFPTNSHSFLKAIFYCNETIFTNASNFDAWRTPPSNVQSHVQIMRMRRMIISHNTFSNVLLSIYQFFREQLYHQIGSEMVQFERLNWVKFYLAHDICTIHIYTIHFQICYF